MHPGVFETLFHAIFYLMSTLQSTIERKFDILITGGYFSLNAFSILNRYLENSTRKANTLCKRLLPAFHVQ